MTDVETTIICLLAVLLVAAVYLLAVEHRKRISLERENTEINQLLSDYAARCIDGEKELTNLKSEYSEQIGMADEIKSLHEKSRRLKHDMKNHLLVLVSYLNEGKYDTAREYIGNIIDKLNKMYSYIYVGNSLMNYIINDKLSAAYERGIDVKAEIENLEFSYMESIDFSALLGNILDNAVTAAEQSSEKFIGVHIYHSKGFDVINVRNSIDGSVLESNPDLKTTKSGDGHGFGIAQIKSVTEKYGGMLDIYEENGFFVMNAVYPS